MSLGSPAIAHADTLLITQEVVVPLSTTTVRMAVEHEFGTSSIMVAVARCESKFRQFDTNDKPLRGAVNPKDVGVFQVNEYWHLKDSKRLGMNIETLQGNLEYAHMLYRREGTTPWNASKYCWNK